MKMLIPVLAISMVASACQLSSVPGLPTSTPSATAPVAGRLGPAPIPGTPISAGQTLTASIKSTDPHCWDNWDATAACRQFDFTAPGNGDLVTTMTWVGADHGVYNPELMLISTDGSYVYCEGTGNMRSGRLPVKSGLTYRILVLSYADALDFSLTTNVQP